MIKFEVNLPFEQMRALIDIAEIEQLSTDAVIRRALINYRCIAVGSHELKSKQFERLAKEKEEIHEAELMAEESGPSIPNSKFSTLVSYPTAIPADFTLSYDKDKLEALASQCTCYLPSVSKDAYIKECKAKVHIGWGE